MRKFIASVSDENYPILKMLGLVNYAGQFIQLTDEVVIIRVLDVPIRARRCWVHTMQFGRFSYSRITVPIHFIVDNPGETGDLEYFLNEFIPQKCEEEN